VRKKSVNRVAFKAADTRKSSWGDAQPGYPAQARAKATKALIHTDTLQRYLSSISKFKLLTRDEEQNLFKRLYSDDDRQAAQLLVTSNLRLVVKIALDYRRLWMQNLLDLIQEGNIGLIKAVEKFDPDKKVKFSYYASFWIKAYIIKHLMDNWRLVKIGITQAQRKLFFGLKREKQKLRDMGFEPKPELLSERLGVSQKEVVEMNQRELDIFDQRIFADESLIYLFQNGFWASLANLWDLTRYAIFAWLILSPFLVLVLYSLLKPVIRTFAGSYAKLQSSK
jgi:RNA polymerase sigma factor (sigma-70 family)